LTLYSMAPTIDENNVRAQNILLIDDDSITLELVQLILEEFISGEIFAFSSSVKALNFVRQLRPNELTLVICDWQMPKVDGLDILRALRENDQNTPFLMLTGSATRELVIAAKKSGATDFIAKPFKNVDLTDKVQKLLGVSHY
jgi:two-component system chemotaxis response regulator CheY